MKTIKIPRPRFEDDRLAPRPIEVTRAAAWLSQSAEEVLAQMSQLRGAMKRRVIIESPFAGKTPEERARNVRYLQACLRDSLLRGEAPFASHGLYPGALNDDEPAERELGIQAGFAWREVADATVMYLDLGESYGMQLGRNAARYLRQEQRANQEPEAHWHVIEERLLGADWDKAEPLLIAGLAELGPAFK